MRKKRKKMGTKNLMMNKENKALFQTYYRNFYGLKLFDYYIIIVNNDFN